MAWHDGRKSWEVNAQHLVKDLQASEGAIRHAVHRDLEYNPCVLRRDHLMRLKATLKPIQVSRRTGVCLLFSDENNVQQDEKSIEEMIGGFVREDPTEVPTDMYRHQVSGNIDDFRINAVADTYVETLQVYVVKSPQIDRVPNGGRPLPPPPPHVFQLDSAPSLWQLWEVNKHSHNT
ncbi:hypothetical protein ACTXT7_017259 [Hymenolepis weldensis]